MISSIPNYFCCITKPCRNKVMLKNESKFIVKYEVYIYKGASVGKIDAAIGTGVFEGRTALEIIQAEGLNPEEGRIPVGGTAYVTCGYGGKIAIRYFFEDLHADYTDELRNFQVLDVIKFLQPSETEIEKITERKKEAENLEQELNNKKIRCGTSNQYKSNCSDNGNGPKIQCPICGGWYCVYHSEPKNMFKSALTISGHYCPNAP